MIKYVCFLRGVNVGGSKVIKMADLKKIFESFKLNNVRTFIQSGNIIFESSGRDYKKLNSRIEKGLHKALGYEVEAALRSMDVLKEIISNNPFQKIETGKRIKFYVTFLSEVPPAGKAEDLESFSYDAESVKVNGTEVYIMADKDKTGTKPLFTNNFIEKKLGLKGTSRDMNTLVKIVNLQ